LAGLAAALSAVAQYPGQVAKNAKETPELRSIAVLEWVGEPGKPTRSRLIPVAVLDGGQLQDGGIYLARPEPLSLQSEVEYELEQNGKPIGLYDIRNAGQEQGSWVGFGAWRPIPVARPRPAAQLAHPRIDDDAQSDEPVLHRKHHADEKPNSGSGKSGGSGSQAGDDDPVADPDRPTLHKKTSSGGASDSTADTSSDPDHPTLHKKASTDSSADADGSQTADTSSDPDRPTLHKKSSSSTADSSESASASSDDPDRPVLHKSRKGQQDDIGHTESVDTTDPDRPTLKRGQSSGPAPDLVPTLIGLPPDVQQTVAVSDAKTHPAHPWTYSWSSPDDEAKMKASLEDLARTALGLNAPAEAPKRTPVRTGTVAARKAKVAPPPPAPAPLSGEQFHVFELAYGSGATLVLSAHTDGLPNQQKFVTLVAQPDLYGNVLVLMKNVTDGTHLDETPRMRLVDAVDAMADNRGELLFELRGQTQRQFALYRVLRGQADKLFVSGGGDFGVDSRN
jgi:hypothetical protein